MSLKQQLGETLELPPELLGEAVKISWWSDGRLTAENHRGVLAYDPQCIELAGDGVIMAIEGDGLRIIGFDPLEVRLTGQIRTVCFKEREE